MEAKRPTDTVVPVSIRLFSWDLIRGLTFGWIVRFADHEESFGGTFELLQATAELDAEQTLDFIDYLRATADRLERNLKRAA